MSESLPKEVVKLTGTKSGPVVAVFAGVHGDERAGIIALKNLRSMLEIQRGTLFLVLANPSAVKKNVRFVNKNLNRCFFETNNGQSYEDKRARELMGILNKCDVLLDLHSFSNPQGPAFAICEENAFDVAKIFDVGIISSGWSQAEPGGTDGYMFENSKVGICLECGPIDHSEKYSKFAEKSVYQFLKFYGLVDSDIELSTSKKRHIRVKYAHTRKSKNFVMDNKLKNFQKLEPGQWIATEDSRQYRANSGEYIIFPSPIYKVGQEVYIIGQEVNL